MLTYMREQHKVSIRQSCTAVGIPRSSYGYKRKPKDDQPVIDELLTLTSKYPVVIASWRDNWEKLTTYFQYKTPIRTLIYNDHCGGRLSPATAQGH